MGFHKLYLLLFFGFLLSGCGGGGGSDAETIEIPGAVGSSLIMNLAPDGVEKKYQGLQGSANIDIVNANQIAEAFLQGNALFFNDKPEIENKTSQSEFSYDSVFLKDALTNIPPVRSHSLDYINTKKSSNKVANRSVTETQNGSVSGHVTLTGEINDYGLGTVTMNWNNFNNGDGLTINGISTIQILRIHFYDEYFYDITDFKETYSSFTFTDGTYETIIEGQIKTAYNIDSHEITQEVNTDIYTSEDQRWFSFDNVQYTVKDSGDYHLKGRLYHSDIGYFDVESENYLTSCNDCEQDFAILGSAVSIIDDEGNTITLYPINDERIKIKVENETGGIEDENVYALANLSGSPLPNVAPTIELDLPHSHSVGKDLVADASIYDLDLDEYSYSVTWVVNDQEQSDISSFILPSEKFRPDDEIKITVTATDGVFVSTESDSIVIFNAKPVAKAGVDQTISYKQRIFVDGSQSYDPDGDPITFEWSASGDSKDVIIVSPNQPSTEVILPTTGEFSIWLKVRDERADENDYGWDYLLIDHQPQELLSDKFTIDFDPTNSYVDKPKNIAIGDVTGDGDIDLTYTAQVANEGELSRLQLGLSQLNKPESLSTPELFTSPLGDANNSKFLKSGDIDGDGVNEIIMGNDNGFSYYSRDLKGAFSHQGDYSSKNPNKGYPSFCDIADMTGDGRGDVVCFYNGGLQLFVGKQDGSFSEEESDFFDTTPWSSTMYWTIQGMKLVDVTHDGKNDVVLRDISGEPVFFQQTSDGFSNFQLPEEILKDTELYTIADLNKDDFSDLVILKNGIPVIYSGSETGFTSLYSLKPPQLYNPHQIEVADINNDSLDDIVVFYRDGKIAIYLRTSSGEYDIPQTFSFGGWDLGYFEYWTVLDLNKDGTNDIVVVRSNMIEVMYGGSALQ